MSLADDPRKFGIITMTVAVLTVISGIALFFDIDLGSHWDVIGGIGCIIAGALIFSAGYAIRSGTIPAFAYRYFPDGPDSKTSVLTGYMAALGLAAIIGLGTNAAMIVIGVIVGITMLVIARILTNDRNGIVSRTLWIVLHVACYLGIVCNLLPIFSASQLAMIAGLCGCLMYLLLDVYLFDDEVKMKFGM